MGLIAKFVVIRAIFFVLTNKVVLLGFLWLIRLSLVHGILV